ncbi:hypothetical protein ACLOJK_010886 [Asimina triloba]
MRASSQSSRRSLPKSLPLQSQLRKSWTLVLSVENEGVPIHLWRGISCVLFRQAVSIAKSVS